MTHLADLVCDQRQHSLSECPGLSNKIWRHTFIISSYTPSFNNGKICNQGCLPSTFSKWVHHGLVDGLPAIVVVRMCLLSSDNRWMTQINSGNYFFISLKLFVKNILISSKSSLNASMTSGQHSQSLRLGRNYRISFCLLNIFKKRNSSQRPKTDMQNTA